MRIDKLVVRGFRNLDSVAADFPSRVTFIVGPNGQGKTNLLEAIYLLSQAKSFRHAALGDLLPWGSKEGCLVEAKVRSSEGTKTIAFEIENGRRRVSVNGNRVSKASAFYGQLCAVVFSPDDLQLVKGGPAARRRFLDRTLSMVDASFVDHVVAYERALKSRNALLKRGRGGGSALNEKLDVWDRLLVKHGLEVARGRSELVKELLEPTAAYYRRLVARSRSFAAAEDISLSYRGDFFCGGAPRQPEEVSSLLAEARGEDVRRGVSTRGVQRDEMLLEIDVGSGPHEARLAASQGQARSFALALLLAAVEFLSERRGELPVLLLDDIESELDTHRKTALFELIKESEFQLFLTLTELPPEFAQGVEDSRVLRIEKGQLSRQ